MATLDLNNPARSVRDHSRLSQEAAAERIRHSQAAVARAEKRGDGITVRALRGLCEALGLELILSVKRRRR
jgi:hypothetical protein